jgi:hypothetical protein
MNVNAWCEEESGVECGETHPAASEGLRLHPSTSPIERERAAGDGRGIVQIEPISLKAAELDGDSRLRDPDDELEQEQARLAQVGGALVLTPT